MEKNTTIHISNNKHIIMSLQIVYFCDVTD